MGRLRTRARAHSVCVCARAREYTSEGQLDVSAARGAEVSDSPSWSVQCWPIDAVCGLLPTMGLLLRARGGQKKENT